jgi:Holliday junction resolvase
MSGRKSRDKGLRIEREVVHAFQARGIAAERIPLSGAAGGRFSADVSLPILGADKRAEVKCKAEGFRELYRWLEGADLLVVRADRQSLLAVVPMELFLDIVSQAEAKR